MPEQLTDAEFYGWFAFWLICTVLGMVLQERQRKAEREQRMAWRRAYYGWID